MSFLPQREWDCNTKPCVVQTPLCTKGNKHKPQPMTPLEASFANWIWSCPKWGRSQLPWALRSLSAVVENGPVFTEVHTTDRKNFFPASLQRMEKWRAYMWTHCFLGAASSHSRPRPRREESRQQLLGSNIQFKSCKMETACCSNSSNWKSRNELCWMDSLAWLLSCGQWWSDQRLKHNWLTPRRATVKWWEGISLTGSLRVLEKG